MSYRFVADFSGECLIPSLREWISSKRNLVWGLWMHSGKERCWSSSTACLEIAEDLICKLATSSFQRKRKKRQQLIVELFQILHYFTVTVKTWNVFLCAKNEINKMDPKQLEKWWCFLLCPDFGILCVLCFQSDLVAQVLFSEARL